MSRLYEETFVRSKKWKCNQACLLMGSPKFVNKNSWNFWNHLRYLKRLRPNNLKTCFVRKVSQMITFSAYFFRWATLPGKWKSLTDEELSISFPSWQCFSVTYKEGITRSFQRHCWWKQFAFEEKSVLRFWSQVNTWFHLSAAIQFSTREEPFDEFIAISKMTCD